METTMVTMQDSEVKISSGGSSAHEDQPLLQTLQANQILEVQTEESDKTKEVEATRVEKESASQAKEINPHAVDQRHESATETTLKPAQEAVKSGSEPQENTSKSHEFAQSQKETGNLNQDESAENKKSVQLPL